MTKVVSVVMAVMELEWFMLPPFLGRLAVIRLILRVSTVMQLLVLRVALYLLLRICVQHVGDRSLLYGYVPHRSLARVVLYRTS